MKEKKVLLEECGLSIPTILLPKQGIDIEKWAVVACDQFTSEPEYWNKVEELTKHVPSTFHIILPEVYLESPNKQDRIDSINKEMQRLLDKELLIPSVKGFILVQRKLKNGFVRNGLMVALDLERYDYTSGSKAMIRATEKTVLERIPPRVQIRVNAPIEVPHILVLFDDPEKSIIEPVVRYLEEQKVSPLYSTNLMLEGGSIQGYSITDELWINQIASGLARIRKEDGFLFAVGDGNHSLATAKQCWENIKKGLSAKEIETHPARYTLVEINNIYDNGLIFEPIHRVMFHVNREHLLNFISGDGPLITVIMGEETKKIRLKKKNSHLEVGVLQILLDEYITLYPASKIDYIHGEASLRKLSTSPDSIGFLLSSMDKHDLFKTVEMDGALPRKTFSMGEAEEKRYYMECRAIK